MRAYLELIRLPNLFTAMADVLLGYFAVATIERAGDGGVLALLVAASSLLYAAGVVLNDVFDLAVDRAERPERPLPSGRIGGGTAARLGWGLLAAGIIAGGTAAALAASPRTALVAIGLAASIVAYDAALKRTPAGPVAMGACRALNVLLGMSVGAGPWTAAEGLIAAGVGAYVAGLTWFARQEAGRSRRVHLIGGLLVMLAGIGLLAWLPAWRKLGGRADTWQTLMVALGLLVAWRLCRAIADPSARRVQTAVQQSILSLVVLDAAVCLAVAGGGPALAVLALLAPAVAAGYWIRST